MMRYYAHPAADGYPAMDEDPGGDYVAVEDLVPLLRMLESSGLLSMLPGTGSVREVRGIQELMELCNVD